MLVAHVNFPFKLITYTNLLRWLKIRLALKEGERDNIIVLVPLNRTMSSNAGYVVIAKIKYCIYRRKATKVC